MRKFWPSFGGVGDALTFWQHEWCKHGTCAALDPSLRGPYKFFNKVLQLHDKLNLLQNFAEHLHILPGKGHCYNYTDVVGKMKSYFNESVIAGECSVNQVDASRVTRPGRCMHCNCLYIGVLRFIFHLNRFCSSQNGGEGSLNIHVHARFFWHYLAIISGKLQANYYLSSFHDIARFVKLISAYFNQMLGHSII